MSEGARLGTSVGRLSAPLAMVVHSHADVSGIACRYSSLGNHDVLGGIEGVNEQIAYTKKNKAWYLPARCGIARIANAPQLAMNGRAHASAATCL